MPTRNRTTASHSTPTDTAGPTNLNTTQAGVRGWLLALCMMLTMVAPVIAAWLMSHEFKEYSKYFSTSNGMLIACLVSLALSSSAVVFGIYAGVRLWTVAPNAVDLAKHALLFGLAAKAVSTAIKVAAGPAPWPDAQFINQTLVHMLPSLVFFTACFAYLNRSRRVSVTFAPRRA